MIVKDIEVIAGRVVSHPRESYANIRCSLKLGATIADGEDYATAVKALQAKAEQLIEEHKDTLLAAIVARDDLREADREIASLQVDLQSRQEQLERARSRRDEIMGKPALPADTRDPLEEVL